METLALGARIPLQLHRSRRLGSGFLADDGRATPTSRGMWIVGEDMPQSTNRVTLSDAASDQWGLPAPNVHFDDHANDVAMRDYAYERAEKLYEAVGAVQHFRTPPYPTTHNLGTCRMSEHAEDGVVDRWGRAHEVPNLFISDGSVMTTGGAANPTLTIVALATRQAEYLAGELKSGNI